ncbi:MAG TPA: AAA family ATPase, partial [Chloroflexota bacterium]|nr:AAA family ATPase [Chloroflexota bacterium]
MIDPNGYSAHLIKVLVVSDAQDTRMLITMTFEKESGIVAQAAPLSGSTMAALLREHAPQLVVVAETETDQASVVESIERERPDVPALVIVPDGAFDLVQQCTLAGARAVLTDSFAGEQLIGAVRRILEREHWRRQLPTASDTRWPASVIAVHGGKGGVGATTIACNLAAALQRTTGRRVALVDGDVLSGATAVLLDLAPIRTVSDLVEEVHRGENGRPEPVRDVADLVPNLSKVDAETLRDVMVNHRSGVDVLLAPDQLQDAEALSGEHMQKAISALSEHYEIVVVDTSSNLTPITLAALDAADKIVVVMTPELVPLRNASRFLQLCGRLGFAQDKVELVINRADSKSDISPTVVQDLLRRP